MSKTQKKSDAKSSRRSPRLNQVGSTVPAPVGKLNSKLQDIKENYRNQKKNETFGVEDVYEKAQSARDMRRGMTGLVYDTRMVNHHCLWDSAHQECPDRFSKTLDRCVELGLVERCQIVQGREATETELLTVHSQQHIDRLKQTDGCQDLQQMEQLASGFDAVYIHPETYKLALLSAGCTIQLVHEVCCGNVHNGMAIVRPPGHHAMHSDFCGYCFFNNVAVAARHALDHLGMRRILIVDWDVHHGQATQQMFYNDPRVVYFSIHRYEHGEFWPNLRESEFDFVGEGAGGGFNFNLPLNKTGMGDNDYMAIFHQVLLPMAAEFQPELIIVSAGYDAALGCPEGEMSVTPACYAHLVSSLMGLASGKVAVILEGGYCVRSLAEGAALTLRALLGDPCPNLPPLSPPSNSVQDSILNCVYSHRAYWRCFQWQASYCARDRGESETQHWPQVVWKYTGVRTDVYPTRNTCPVQSQAFKDEINNKLDRLLAETKLLKTKHNVCFVYDPLMMEHKNFRDPGHPERPSRIQKIYEKHLEYKLLDRLHILQSRPATREELLLVHEVTYLDETKQLCAMDQLTDDLKHKLSVMERKDSVYIHPQSYESASLATGSLLQVVDSVMQGESRAGVAVIRPPGHHAESYAACGFCLFNNVAVAAKYALKHYDISRVLILDWDVHHGNGTQRIFLSDPRVLYMSIHRYDRGTFFPSSEDAAATVVGDGDGVGFNVNIPWNQKGMGNAEYVMAFQQVVMPIAYQFAPQLVLVSAGFDAAINDPLGGCKVAPEAYALFTSWLSPLAQGRVIICLEGGYNLTSIAYSMTLCTKALLGDPSPPVSLPPWKPSAAVDLRTVLDVQKNHWSAVFNKSFPKEDVLKEGVEKTAYSVDKFPDNIDEICEGITKVSIEDEQRDVEGKVGGKETPSGEKSSDSTHPPVEDCKPGSSQGSANASGFTLKITTTIDSILQELGMDEGFAIHPRHDCPHVEGAVTAVPATGLNTSAPCVECGDDPCATVENWICLTCYTVHCGRVIKEHMMLHSLELSHPIVLGYQDLSVWCYSCDSYIESPILYEAKNAAYQSKFGENMPNIYTNQQQ
ncbi:histone deacetylase 6-like isoform X1 [Macrosteles quadrilineatus]|uniref:histone deacetylase 6-like isoform X1 n=1 Tax=Macrosteles quadrilineatus TaxID=74068 RepID=UPI0023E10110|nr:histone deacetylase 6-like isoform X1 [Macrosteles quadrilineatus]XP_054266823.1 histone deacetylase 6-like isoform X1 [Macrosteles quadrilineatus]